MIRASYFLSFFALYGAIGGCAREKGGAPSTSADPPRQTAPVMVGSIAPTASGDAATRSGVADDAGGGRADADGGVNGAGVNGAGPDGAGGDGSRSLDPMELHSMDAAELFALAQKPDHLQRLFAAMPGRYNLGNKELAHHSVSKKACLDGLRGTTLQTPEQRDLCGAENMVPIWRGGSDPKLAKTCIDIFEFPNRPCELPMVWGSPTQAVSICRAMGKRLCTQDEWQLGCGGDPAGGPRSLYAYGNTLDLNVCHTNKPHPVGSDGKNFRCNPASAQSAWSTCSTDTEPAGSFPRCRSRFGVFDQHGNVAEMMTRKTADGAVVTQLKGSAFFYVDVAREHDKPQPKDAPRDTYPDHCNYDARWHIEPIDRALHVNYHLGFRCCKDVTPPESSR